LHRDCLHPKPASPPTAVRTGSSSTCGHGAAHAARRVSMPRWWAPQAVLEAARLRTVDCGLRAAGCGLRAAASVNGRIGARDPVRPETRDPRPGSPAKHHLPPACRFPVQPPTAGQPPTHMPFCSCCVLLLRLLPPFAPLSPSQKASSLPSNLKRKSPRASWVSQLAPKVSVGWDPTLSIDCVLHTDRV